MAGIGWKLEKLLERESLGSAISAYLTGVAVTSGPWLLTTMVLVLMRVSAVRYGAHGIYAVERVITVVYALVLVLGAPVDVVLSRFASDRVYEGRADRIAAPLRRALSGTLVAFGAIGAAAVWLLDVPDALLAPGVLLAVIVGGQWLLLSAAGGLSSPGVVLKGFAFGAPVSVVAAIALARTELAATGYLWGFAAGQGVTLGILLIGTLRALPADEDDSARFGPALVEYWLLAAAAMAFHAGIWVDKVVIYLQHGASAASAYAALAAMAWLSVVPASAYLFIMVETRFYRAFRGFYGALEGGAALAELEERSAAVRAQARRTLRGTAAVQVGITLIAAIAAPAILEPLGFGGGAIAGFRALLVGSTLQVIALATILLLYYFDFRWEAFSSAFVLAVINGLATAGFADHAPVGTGYAVACGIACAVAISLLWRRLDTLLADTFQSQPYAGED